MKHTLALVLIVLGIVGCATTMNPSSPRAQALMQEVRAERLAAQGQISTGDYKTYCYDEYYGSSPQVSACAEIAAERLAANQKNELTLTSYLTTKNVVNLIQMRTAEIREREQQHIRNCMIEHASDYDSRIECLGKEDDSLNQYYESIANHVQIVRQKQKTEILIALTQRCNSYEFTGDFTFSDCIKKEAERDRVLAVTRIETSQKNTWASNVAAPKEVRVPWLIKFLGDVVMGVAEEYPAAVLEAQQRKNAYNRGLKKGRAQAKPNCGGPNCY